MSTGVNILSAGMVTAVGLDRASACAAMRAGLDGFCETQFIAPGGAWLLGAPVPLPRNWIGENGWRIWRRVQLWMRCRGRAGHRRICP
jgi:hypothetical protein